MRLYNPIYHFKRATVDIRALRHGFSTLGQPQKFTSVDQLTEVLHGRMILAATVAIPSTITGIVVGAIVQAETGSIPAGLLVNLIIANVLGTIGLEVLWACLSRDLYAARQERGFKKLGSVARDLGVIHLHSLLGVMLINTLSMGLTTFVLENIHHALPKWNLNHYVPATLISPIIGWLALDAPFIRYMNDLYAKQAGILAKKYHDVIVSDSESTPLREEDGIPQAEKKTKVKQETKVQRRESVPSKETVLRLR